MYTHRSFTLKDIFSVSSFKVLKTKKLLTDVSVGDNFLQLIFI